jgi:hypothetical protein
MHLLLIGLSGKVAKNKFGQGGKQQIKILKKEVPNEWFDSTKTGLLGFECTLDNPESALNFLSITFSLLTHASS